jgi:hypothetical protein
LLTLRFPVEFEKKGEYQFKFSYTSDLSFEDYTSIDGKTKEITEERTVSVQDAGKYTLEWTISSENLWGYFVESGKSKIKTSTVYYYSNNDIYPNNKLNSQNPFNSIKQNESLPEQEFEIAGIANSRTKAFPAHSECKKPEIAIILLKQ